MILDQIIEKKRLSVSELKRRYTLSDLEKAADAGPVPRDFLFALKEGGAPAVIAEIKKASPSAGVIREDMDVAAIAACYKRGGAAAISVITEEEFFLGKPEYLGQAREAASLPVLCKDFIFDPVQVLAARSSGADAMLLIASVLDPGLLSGLLAKARSLGMHCLVEVHDQDELAKALASGASIIGINNRNLETFEVSLETTIRLRPMIPPDRFVVSESGIHTRADMEALSAAGVDAVLVGTSLMRSDDPEQKLRELRGLGRTE